MKIYFCRITVDHWTAKNNLEKAAHKLAREMDRTMIFEKEINSFKNIFQEKIGALNKEYNRCKPLRFSITSSYGNSGGYSIWCGGVFHMEIFLAKQEL